MRKTVLFLTAAIVPAAWGAPLVCNVEGPDVSLGILQLFSEYGVTMTAYGFDDATSTPDKDDPSEENDVGAQLGLGFLGTIDHELELNRYIQLNLQNLWTADPASSQASIESAPAGEGDEPFGSNTPPPAGIEIESASLTSTADNLNSAGDAYEYNSEPVSSDDAELSTVSGSNAATWELGAVLAASALIGLWLFLRAVLLASRPSRPIRPVRHVRA